MKKLLCSILLVGILSLSLLGCTAETNGNSNEGIKLPKNIEVQVPAKAGGGTDVMARTLAQQISETTESQFTIVNNTSGNGIVPLETIRNAKPDGSKIMQYHTSMLITSAMGLYEYNVLDDFTVIGVAEGIEDGTNVLVVSSDSDFQTLDELVVYAEKNPGKLLFGTQLGGMSHIIAGMIQKSLDVDFNIVEAGSDTDKLTALVGNSIDVTLVNANQAKQYVEAGRVNALAVVTKSDEGGRSSILEDVPSFVEQGYDVTFSILNLILGPKNMDEELVEKLHEYYLNAAQDESVNKVLSPSGLSMEFLSQEKGLEKLSNMVESINFTVKELGLDQK